MAAEAMGPGTKNSGHPVRGNRILDADVLIGLFKIASDTNGFSDFRVSNFLNFTSHCVSTAELN